MSNEKCATFYYVLVYKHDTMKLGDTTLYHSEEEANDAARKFLLGDHHFAVRRMGVHTPR